MPSVQSRRVGAAIVTITAALVLTGAGHRVLLAHRDDLLNRYLPPALPWSDFPRALVGYVSEDVPLGSDVLRVAGVDAYVNRVYRSPRSPAPVSLYIGYWGTANAGLGHGPEVCLPVHGWRAAGDPAREQMTLSTSLDRRLQTLTYRTGRFVREDLGEQQEVASASFHIVNDKLTLTPAGAFVHGPGNPFRPKLHYSLQFQIITPIVRGDVTQATARLTGFLREAVPQLARHLPPRSVELTPKIKGGKPK